MSQPSYEDKVAQIEKDLGWTEEEASNCGCNSSPEGPCANCWSLGWRIGGIEKPIAETAP